MDPTVLVALITGVVTAVSTLGGTALAAHRAEMVERWRAEYALEREREQREDERDRSWGREVRTRLDDVRRAVLQLDIGMRHIAQLRAHGPPKQGGNDLPEQVRQARDHLYEAVVAVERVRDVLPPDRQEPVDDLREAVDQALNHLQVGDGPGGEVERAHEHLTVGLRRLAEAFPAGAAGTGGEVEPSEEDQT